MARADLVGRLPRERAAGRTWPRSSFLKRVAMNKRKLGRTNLHVSELCLNTTKFGWSNDEANSLALLDAYYTCGGRFLQSLGFSPNSVTAQAIESGSEDIIG